jgi:predicted MarR family transcription regulator
LASLVSLQDKVLEKIQSDTSREWRPKDLLAEMPWVKPPQMSYALGRLVEETKLIRRSEGRAAFYCVPGTAAAEAAARLPTGSRLGRPKRSVEEAEGPGRPRGSAFEDQILEKMEEDPRREWRPKDLLQVFRGKSPMQVNYALKKLLEAELLVKRSEGRAAFYSLASFDRFESEIAQFAPQKEEEKEEVVERPIEEEIIHRMMSDPAREWRPKDLVRMFPDKTAMQVNYALKKLIESRRLEKRSAGRGAYYRLVSLSVDRESAVGEESQCPVCSGAGRLPVLGKALAAAGLSSMRGLRDELACIECGEPSYFTGVAGDRLVYRCLTGHAVTLTVEAAAHARHARPDEGEGGAGKKAEGEGELEFGAGEDDADETEEEAGYY